ncbi:MAG TPA: DNA polymerase III subunit gamma/tau [bacterium]|nr:DNA polymerase III subunit gamma/tau [bacterium]
MSYQVIARKWRPKRFDEVIGQGHVTNALKYAIREGRIAPVILFTGIRGTGKTTLARILVKAFNCLSPLPDGEPCNVCENCTEIMAGRSPDVFEIDGASNNSVDDVRTIRENIAYSPVKSKRKAYIIDEVHMLSKSAFNALLKTLEEPPSHTAFILATTDPQKIPTTVLSRCQRYDLKRLGLTDIVTQLEKILTAEGIAFERDALYLLAREGEGSMRDAQTLVEQMLAFGERQVTCPVVSLILGTSDRKLIRDIVTALAARDANGAVAAVRGIYESGKALEKASRDVLLTLHQLVLASSLADDHFIEAPEEEKKWVRETAKKLSAPDWLRLFDYWNGEHDAIVRSDYSLMLFEVAVVIAASFPAMADIRELIDRVDGAPAAGLAPKAELHAAPKSDPKPVVEKPQPVTAPVIPMPAPVEKKKETPPVKEEPPVAGWREFVERFAGEDPMLASGLKAAKCVEEERLVTVQMSTALEAAIGPKRGAIERRYAALTGGKQLRFEAEVTGGRAVTEQEAKEEADKIAKMKEEIRKDGTLQDIEQLGFDLKKIVKTK